MLAGLEDVRNGERKGQGGYVTVLAKRGADADRTAETPRLA